MGQVPQLDDAGQQRERQGLLGANYDRLQQSLLEVMQPTSIDLKIQEQTEMPQVQCTLPRESLLVAMLAYLAPQTSLANTMFGKTENS